MATHVDIPPAIIAWEADVHSPVGSPMKAVWELRTSRPSTAPAASKHRRKKQLPVGSPKWWARLTKKTEAEEEARRLAAQERIDVAAAVEEAANDCRNFVALWWLKV